MHASLPFLQLSERHCVIRGQVKSRSSNFMNRQAGVTCFFMLYIVSLLCFSCMLSRSLSSLAKGIRTLPLRAMSDPSAASKPKALSTSSTNHTFCRTVNASEVAASFTAEIKSAIQASLDASPSAQRPKLVGFLCGKKDSPSVTYADWTRKACESVGIEYELRLIETEQEEGDDQGQESVGGAALGAADLETAILEANSDP